MEKEIETGTGARRSHEENFKANFKKLNAEQKKAVTTIEGPVLVNAGPGTGKTQILASRIGKILIETDTAQHNILCLTYTDAATVAMRERLVKIIGPAAHQVHIHTFHGFCNKVIQENLDIFGGFRQLEPLGDLEEVDIYRELIDNLPSDNILKRFKGDRYFEKGRMKNLFDLMKKENISSTEFVDIIDRHLEEARNSVEFIAKAKSKDGKYQKGDFRDDWYADYARKFSQTRAAAQQYDNYKSIMMSHERYDYHDMILWVLEEFKNNDSLLSRYQERYHYFLVDEYQDTNGAQNAILSFLVNYWDRPNVFVVGDDDQAIYKFQGASIDNLVKFKNDYQPEIVVLKKNYRSNQHVLDTASALIHLNTRRLVNTDDNLKKELLAEGDFRDDPTKPRVLQFEKLSDEYAWHAGVLAKLAESKPEELKETAVIYRKHKQVEDLLSILEKKSIPYNVKKRINALDQPLIKNILNILNYIRKEYESFNSADVVLFEIMHYPWFELHTLDIAKISFYRSRRRRDEESIALREIIADEKILDTLNLKEPEKVKSVSRLLEFWIGNMTSMTIQKLFEDILNDGGILTHIMSKPDRAWRLQMISTLFDLIKNESAKNGELGIGELLTMIDKMKENRIDLPVNKVISSEDGVHFVTAHSAKGLEFKNVFLLGCSKKIWDNTGRSGNQAYKYPDGINSRDDSDVEDERRLFFVAMTRAKTNLVMSYSRQTEEGKDLGASQFIDEVRESGETAFEEIKVPEEQLVQFYHDIFRKSSPVVPIIEKSLIDEWLKSYSLSVTHLNKYLSCPISFYFENILRVPSARNAYTGYGSSMHEALYEFLKELKSKGLKDSSHLTYAFREAMKYRRSHFTPEEFESFLELGIKNLELLYADRIEEWKNYTDIALEEELSDAEANGVPIKGFIDKVVINKQHVHVVDYKTGVAKKSKSKLRPPNDRYPDGGDYWRQLVFYRILLESDKKHNWIMESAEIDFIEPDRLSGEFTREKIFVNDMDMDFVKSQIRECYDKIKAYQFDEGCGEDDCRWCTFMEDNKLSIA